MRSVALLVVAAVVGCFPPDLGDGKIKCASTGERCPPNYYCHADNLCWKAQSSGGNPDLSGGNYDLTGGGCVNGQRLCINNDSQSAVCQGGVPVADRTCPPTSTCSKGYCQPPAGAMACKRPCAQGVCTPFVVNNGISTFCAPALGTMTGPLQSCTKTGFDSMCDSGYCVQDSKNGSSCFYSCMAKSDCAPNNCIAVASSTTVEGVGAGALTVCGQ
jgi:hypothetical protein